MQSEKLLGLPVIHIDLGKRCGTVQGLVLNPQTRCVAGLVIGLAGWRQRGLLPIEYVFAIGEQAVTIVDETAIKSIDDESELRTLMQRKLDLRGMPVLTVTGCGLGTVESFDFAPDGIIQNIVVHRGNRGLRRKQAVLAGQLIRSFGEDAVIVAAEAVMALESEHASRGSTEARPQPSDTDSGEADPPSLEPTLAERWRGRVSAWGRRAEPAAQEGPVSTDGSPRTDSVPMPPEDPSR